MNKPLGCLSRSGIVAALLTWLLLLAVGLVWRGALFSPGPLNAQPPGVPPGGVRSHAELSQQCSACHPAPWSQDRMSDRCLACHSDVRLQLEDSGTLHGALLAVGGTQACYACHPEHRGLDAPLTVVDNERFPHDATGYSLQGHQKSAEGLPFTCTDCHGSDSTAFDPAQCVGCHGTLDASCLQAHEEAFGTACLDCHDGIDTYGQQFDHNQLAFALLGKHGILPCEDCHTGARTPTDLKATPQGCYACHQADDTHAGQLGTDCGACHTPGGWLQATFDHTQTAFPLLGLHIGSACRDCHVESIYRGTPHDCNACHQADDAHDGQLGTDCAACHTPDDWPEATFDHTQSAFPLLGRHADTACGQCHADGIYRGTPQDCYACHQADDAHDGELGTDCASCHTPDGWQEATFDHAQSAFPLQGRHADTACHDCHADGIYRGTPQDCYACHQADDAHDGQLGTDCAACHTPGGWQEATFDHAQSAFPLLGRHADTDCGQCHADGIYRGTPQDCYACHQADDTHSGQYGRDCAACHTPDGWSEATFDHAQSAFPLRGRHASTACGDCHADGVFRGTPKACQACHADPPFHAGLLGQDCAACHNAEAWTPARYDRSHTFPISHGESGPSPCRTCHTNDLQTYGCYGCHEHDPSEIEHKHREEDIADFRDCADCHPTGREDEAKEKEKD
jgi:hypothetical protein